jgi:hypothetical protein
MAIKTHHKAKQLAPYYLEEKSQLTLSEIYAMRGLDSLAT